MSPSAALADPVFRAYVGIVVGVLIGAGAVLAVLQFVFRIELGNVWKTYRSWLWMAPLAAAVIFAGRGPFIIGVTALAILSFKEFALASGLDRDRWMIVTVSAGIVAVGVAACDRHLAHFRRARSSGADSRSAHSAESCARRGATGCR